MSLPRGACAAALALVLIAMGAAATPAPAGAHARTTTAFLDSIGVNTHLTFAGTPYMRFPLVRRRLRELGIHHVRDGACTGCPAKLAQIRRLHRRDGIRFDLIAGKPTDSHATLKRHLHAIRRLGRAVDAIEGANEWDLFAPDKRKWAGQDRRYQRRLWRTVHRTRGLRHTPVIGPSLVFWWTLPSSWTQLGDIATHLTYGNSHGYAGGKPPEVMTGPELDHARAVSRGKPLVMTEAGWHNALGQVNNDHPPTPEHVAAVYVPRLFLANFQAGIRRTYLYELLDEHGHRARTHQEDSFGLLHAGGRPKPAFRALRNLVHELAPHRRHASRVRGARGIRAALPVRHLTLRRPDGGIDVVLWRPGWLWDPLTRTRRALPQTRVALTIPQARRVRAYRPVRSRAAVPLAAPDGRVQVAVGAAPVVLEAR